MTDHPTAPVQDDDAEWWMQLVEPITRAIVFEDCGNTTDWKDNTNLGIAVVNAIRPLLASRLSPTPETGLVEALTDVHDTLVKFKVARRFTEAGVGGLASEISRLVNKTRKVLSNVLLDEVRGVNDQP